MKASGDSGDAGDAGDTVEATVGDVKEHWDIFVQLIKLIFEKGELPTQMLWVVIVLLPKGNGDYCGIGLIERFQKVFQIVMGVRLQSIELHYCLHGFLAERGTGTATLELKLAQNLAFLEQEPLFVTFLDLKKVYNALDCERFLAILKGCSVKP